MKKFKLIIAAITITIGYSAQSQDFGDVFRGGTADANLYLEQYLKSTMLSFNYGMASGWYNTAKPHKLLGFDITFTGSFANVPKSERSFDFNSINFNNLQLLSGSSTLPTLVGEETSSRLRIPAGTSIVDPVTGNSITYQENLDFDAPSGLNLGTPVIGAPVPALQLGIGLPKNTDLKIRLLTDFGLLDSDDPDEGSGSLSGFGIGVMHDLKQWVPGLKQVPFDFSGFIGYNSFKVTYDINEGGPTESFEGAGQAELKASSMVIQGVLSKKIAFITPYVGLGYSIASSSIKVSGDYTYRDTSSSQEITISNPVDLNFDGGSTPRLNFGLQMKLLILTLHAEYALQKYSTLTVGVGISIR